MHAELEKELQRLPTEQRRDILRTWQILETAEPSVDGVPSVDDAWADVQRRIRASAEHRHASAGRRPLSIRHQRASAGSHDREPRTSPSFLRHRRLAAAAVALVIAGLALWAWQLPVTATAPAGEQQTVTLADGSTVHLNSGTSLRYSPRTLPILEDRRRTVQLTGEAFFEVVPSDAPFVVKTADLVVDVLGTTFNVRAFPDDRNGGTEVTLASGKVRVADRRRPHHTVTLSEPGTTARLRATASADSTLVKEPATLDHVLAWRRNAFAAIDRPVGVILDELERRYAIRIQSEEGVGLRNSMTLLYGPGTNPERILHDICLVQGCRYRPTSRGFALFVPDGSRNR